MPSLRLILCLVGTVLVAFGLPRAVHAGNVVNASALLRAGAYRQLDDHFSGVQRQFDDGKISGDQLRDVFRAFYPTAPDLAPRYDAWIRAYPKSYVAHVARGIYYKKRGLEERGEKYMSETSQSQVDKMDDAMTKAARDLGVSIGLESKPFLSYLHSLDIGRQYVGAEQSRKLFDKGAQLDPDSFGLRIKFMSALEPRWGGNAAAMRAFLAECRRTRLSAENLAELEAMVEEADGDESRLAGNLPGAEAAYRRALKLGACSCGSVQGDLNRVLFDTQQYAAAITLLDDYLQKKPGDLWALANRGAALLMVGRAPDAIADWRQAADADDSYSELHLGMVYLNGVPGVLAPDYQSSVRLLRRAAAQGEPDALASLPRAEALAAQVP